MVSAVRRVRLEYGVCLWLASARKSEKTLTINANCGLFQDFSGSKKEKSSSTTKAAAGLSAEKRAVYMGSYFSWQNNCLASNRPRVQISSSPPYTHSELGFELLSYWYLLNFYFKHTNSAFISYERNRFVLKTRLAAKSPRSCDALDFAFI